jgi:hypothetical protein
MHRVTATSDVHGVPDGTGTPEEADAGARTSRLPSALLATLLIAFLVLRSAAPVRDADTFWHLASGRQILHGGGLVGPDPLSPFTLSPWIRHAWLPDLGFHVLDALGGPSLLAVALPVMTAVTVVVLYRVLRTFGGRLLSCVLLALTFLTMTGSLSLRPQVLSFAGTAAVTGLWLVWARGGRSPWIAVPLTWVWACCHGLWLLSPVIGAAVLAGAALDRRSVRGLGRPALVVCATGVVGALTPVGPALLLAPLQVRAVAPYIQEWQSTSLTSLPMCALWAILLLDLLASLRLRRRPSFSHLALVTLSLLMGVTAARTVGIAGIIAACASMETLQRSLPLTREPWTRSELGQSVAASAVGVLLGGTLIWAAPQSVVGYPEAPFRTLQAAPAGTVVCAEYEVGSWLLWRHPGIVPSIDGRTEIYTAEQLEEARAFAGAAPGSLSPIREATGCRYAAVHTSGDAAAMLRKTYRQVEVDGELALYDLTTQSAAA